MTARLAWILLASVLLSVLSALGGCTPNAPGAGLVPAQSPDAGPLDAGELAHRLNLQVVRLSNHQATLNGGGDCVTIFSDPDGAVYVNAQRLACDGPLRAGEGTVLVPASLVEAIRPLLRGRAAPPVRRVERPSPVRRSDAEPGRIVVLDPGHGGRDPGATGCNGLREKDVVLEVARLVRQRLSDRGVKVLMTREDDEYVELEDRPAVANGAKADLFVSIHADSAANRAANGHTVYVSRSADEDSLSSARLLTKHLGASSGSRGVQPANYRVLVHADCPAVLLEIGYLSNPEEAGRLATADYRSTVADNIAAGILEWLKR